MSITVTIHDRHTTPIKATACFGGTASWLEIKIGGWDGDIISIFMPPDRAHRLADAITAADAALAEKEPA